MSEETVGDRLEESAKEHGWTLAQFAEKLGVSYETVRKWRAGKTAPNRARQKQIAELLGKTAEWVMYGVASPAASSVVVSAQQRLSEAEERLIAAYRRVLNEDRDDVLARLEKRANELDELSARIASQRFGSPVAASRKRGSA